MSVALGIVPSVRTVESRPLDGLTVAGVVDAEDERKARPRPSAVGSRMFQAMSPTRPASASAMAMRVLVPQPMEDRGLASFQRS